MKKRCAILSSSCLVIVALCAVQVSHIPPMFIWNHTKSIERGLYIYAGYRVQRGVIVAVSAPPEHRKQLSEGGFLPENVPLMKYVAAVSGDQTCRLKEEIFIRTDPAAIALSMDSMGRQLPVWQGCQLLDRDEIFLLGAHPHSFDSRYFGSVHMDSVIGTYRLMWRARS